MIPTPTRRWEYALDFQDDLESLPVWVGNLMWQPATVHLRRWNFTADGDRSRRTPKGNVFHEWLTHCGMAVTGEEKVLADGSQGYYRDFGATLFAWQAERLELPFCRKCFR